MFYYSKEKKQVRWYVRDWMEYDAVKDNPVDISDLKVILLRHFSELTGMHIIE